MAREFVKDRLKAPATASFSHCPGDAWREKGGDWEIRGYVDAQNTFGAKLRTSYFVRLHWVIGNKWNANSVVLDPT
jgi:hypothetical protein